MAPNTFNAVTLLLVLVSFLSFGTTQANGPTLLSVKCSNDKTTANSTFQTDLKTLFSSLSSEATANFEFYDTTVTSSNSSDTVYGLFMCRGDFSSCGQCVLNATQILSSDPACSMSKEALIWYYECMVRYSNRYFFSVVATSPPFENLNTANISNQESFMMLLFKIMNETADEAARSPVLAKKYATKEANISAYLNLSCLTQCTEDLTPKDFRACLSDAIGELPSCCGGKQGGRVVYPSCNVRYSCTVSIAPPASKPLPPPSPAGLVPTTNSSASAGSDGISLGTIFAIVAPIAVAVLLFILGVCFLSRQMAEKKHDTAQNQHTATEISIAESLRFDFSTVEAATNKFSEANKLGEGGFGEVYKGWLPRGREIYKNSGQGAEQFENEVELVARLQHRHLVRLLGFCLQGAEKILVFEFVPNKSLDYILFDLEKQRLLDWPRRYKIIGGVARGIRYLHEDSQLKIIHRDLKPSNILLDKDMNPKS